MRMYLEINVLAICIATINISTNIILSFFKISINFCTNQSSRLLYFIEFSYHTIFFIPHFILFNHQQLITSISFYFYFYTEWRPNDVSHLMAALQSPKSFPPGNATAPRRHVIEVLEGLGADYSVVLKENQGSAMRVLPHHHHDQEIESRS